jgi:hypothetical protein
MLSQFPYKVNWKYIELGSQKFLPGQSQVMHPSVAPPGVAQNSPCGFLAG